MEENTTNDNLNNNEEKLSELDECNKKCDEYLNNWKRERADFLNYKKDEMERVGFLGKYVKEDIIFKILPILDNFYLAEKQLPPARIATPARQPDSSHGGGQSVAGGENLKQDWIQGFLQIQSQIVEFLKKEGIEEIETVGDPPSHEASEGQRKFDPSLMEVVEEVKIEGQEPGIVVEEIQKGYKINDKVIRPAKVKITK